MSPWQRAKGSEKRNTRHFASLLLLYLEDTHRVHKKFLPVLYEIPDKMFRTCYCRLKKRKLGKHKHGGTKRNFSLENNA
jgi:hypothetical protein